jgi:hypothetical protein
MQADIDEWLIVRQQLEYIKEKEMELRNKISKALFPDPKEGANKHVLGDYNLTLTHKLTRTIDEASLSNVVRTLHENGIPVDELINYKPSLVLSAYRKLEKEQLKLFDNVLIIKPATPSLSVDKVKK